MVQTFVPGYQAEIIFDVGGSDADLTVVGNVLSMDFTKNVLPKPVFGQQWRNSASGQISGSVSCSGHVSVEILPLLLPLVELETPIDFTIYVGTEGGGIDAGQYAGALVVGSLSVSDDAEGEWEFSIDGETDGPVLFTPPIP